MTKKRPYSVNISGDGGIAQGSVIVVGNNNVSQIAGGNIVTRNVENIESVFKHLKSQISETNFPEDSKLDLQAELDDLFKLLTAEQEVNESAITRRFRNIKRISPEILDVILSTLTNPILGMTTVIKKTAESVK